MLPGKGEVIQMVSSGIPVIDRQAIDSRKTVLLIADLKILSALL